MTRELTNKEKEWIKRLKALLRQVPKTLTIFQSNVDSGLLFYDSNSGEMIEDAPEVQGFLEGDPKQRIEYDDDGRMVGWV